jgi:putative membrane protein
MINEFISYEVIEALHIIAVISWMAGMLYLPRLFVYHAGAAKGSELSETLKIMERRLMKIIMHPAMGLTWILGYGLLKEAGFMKDGWMQAKISLVLAMTALHFYFSYQVKVFARDQNTKTARFYRIINEAPTVLMIMIVLLVVLKP